MSKAIIVTDMPESCSKCKFMYEFYGVKKCQLLNVLKNGGKAIICVDKLNVARKECCPLVSEEEHDKEIREKAIEEFTELLMVRCEESSCKTLFNGRSTDILTLDNIVDEIREIAEQNEGGMRMNVKTIRTHYDVCGEEKGLEATINKIGYKNILQILPCYCGGSEYFYTIIYQEEVGE